MAAPKMTTFAFGKKAEQRFLFYLWVAPHPTRCKIRIKVICTARNTIQTHTGWNVVPAM